MLLMMLIWRWCWEDCSAQCCHGDWYKPGKVTTPTRDSTPHWDTSGRAATLQHYHCTARLLTYLHTAALQCSNYWYVLQYISAWSPQCSAKLIWKHLLYGVDRQWSSSHVRHHIVTSDLIKTNIDQYYYWWMMISWPVVWQRTSLSGRPCELWKY